MGWICFACGWFIMENPIKMDDLGVPLFSEASISQWYLFIIGNPPLAMGGEL